MTASTLALLFLLPVAGLAAESPEASPPPPAVEETPAPVETSPSLAPVRGLVRGADGAPFAGAVVAVLPLNAVAVTSSDGTFAFEGLADGAYTVIVSREGFVGATRDVVVSGGTSPPLEVTLVPLTTDATGAADAGAQEITVTAERLELAPGHTTLHREEVRKIPGTWSDPFRAAQSLPGVARPFLGFFGEIVIRGSSPEDTRVYVDGHEVPMVYHFGALKSLLNPQMIDSIDYLPGGFGSYYGRAIGGVLDAKTRDEIPDESHVHIVSDLLDTALFGQSSFEGSGVWRRGAVAGAVRRSYIDVLVAPFAGELAFSLPRYYDWQLKADGELSNGDEAGLLVFGDDDALLGGGSDPLLRTVFHRVQARWKHEFDGGNTLRASAAGGLDKGFFVGGLSAKPRYHAGLRSDYRARAMPGLDVNVGVDFAGLYEDAASPFDEEDEEDPDDPGNPDETDENPFFTGHPRRFIADAAAYLEAEWSPHPRLTLVPSLRAEWLGSIETGVLDPRFNGRFRADGVTTVLFSGGIYHQPPRVGLLGFFVHDLGALGADIPAERAVHAVAGVERILGGTSTASATAYYKHMDHLVELNLDPSGGSPFGVLDGTGRAYGLELLFRLYPTERIFAWASYTLSKAERRADGFGGGWYPFSYDQTHNLNTVVSFTMTPTVRFGARFKYVTGNPYTPYHGSVYDADTNEAFGIAGRPMSARIPDYYALDLRLDKAWKKRVWTIVAFTDILNATNHANKEFPEYNWDYTRVRYGQGLPILPMIGIEAYR